MSGKYIPHSQGVAKRYFQLEPKLAWVELLQCTCTVVWPKYGPCSHLCSIWVNFITNRPLWPTQVKIRYLVTWVATQVSWWSITRSLKNNKILNYDPPSATAVEMKLRQNITMNIRVKHSSQRLAGAKTIRSQQFKRPNDIFKSIPSHRDYHDGFEPQCHNHQWRIHPSHCDCRSTNTKKKTLRAQLRQSLRNQWPLVYTLTTCTFPQHIGFTASILISLAGNLLYLLFNQCAIPLASKQKIFVSQAKIKRRKPVVTSRDIRHILFSHTVPPASWQELHCLAKHLHLNFSEFSWVGAPFGQGHATRFQMYHPRIIAVVTKSSQSVSHHSLFLPFRLPGGRTSADDQ